MNYVQLYRLQGIKKGPEKGPKWIFEQSICFNSSNPLKEPENAPEKGPEMATIPFCHVGLFFGWIFRCIFGPFFELTG